VIRYFREQFAGRIPPYELVFKDGYQPERIYWDDIESDSIISCDTLPRDSAQGLRQTAVRCSL